MAKYRLLSLEELKELENKFVEYLILNGITADDWIKIKEEESEKAAQIIELFSDVVFEGVLRRTQFLEKRDKKEIKIFQCLKNKFVLVGLNAVNVAEADLTDKQYLQRAMQSVPVGLEVFTSEIAFEQSREKEIFGLTEQGYLIANGDLFKTLCLVLPKEQ